MNIDKIIQNSKSIIIKIGSVLVTNEKDGSVNNSWLISLAKDIKKLHNKKKKVIIVSSGAIALGRKHLLINNNKSSSSLKIEQKQAAASIGQIELMNCYYDAFSTHDLKISQVLLSPNDIENRRSNLNSRATINTLLDNNIIPIINENDSVTTKEIRFGDNDRLAARVAQTINADTLILLSTIDGLYSNDPNIDANAVHIDIVKDIDDDIINMGKDIQNTISTGGMKSKIEAAIIATKAGTNMIISNGIKNHPISNLLSKENKKTIFKSSDKPIKARKKWIMSHLKMDGAISIDDGAYHAILNGKSILPVGVNKVIGKFERGDVIKILNNEQKHIATAITSYSSIDIDKIKGKQTHEIYNITGYKGREEIIHRTNMALL